jgi:cellulose synthase/poly-beta-1,6-N-acetylglucosamine synthase-like glycosyltransferase
MGVMSACLVLMLLYQLFISAFGFRKNTKDYQDFDPQLRFLVLVPAHNEETVISDIINNLKHMEYPPELYDFYILADNCTDGTATVARQMGANVIESFKESEDAATGKPIVLQKALQVLEGYQNRYDLVMFFDADNLIDPNMFLEVNSQFLSNPGNADIIQCYLGSKNRNGIVALFYYLTYTITNRFFQYAKSRLGLNSVIGGTGFAVAADYLHQRGGWTAMSLTEDFELQIEATCDGKRILWNHNVRIYDEKPTRFKASLRQRIRWAKGHWFVAFKNTPRLFRALKAGRVSFKEFVSTFLYMYSLTPYVVLVLQLLLGLAINIFEWTGLLSQVAAAASLASWLLVNLPSILLFFYSFILLFYVGDRMDNGNRFNLRFFIPMCVSVLLNTLLAGLAQIIGLLKHKKQDSWDKTEHCINCLEESNLLPRSDDNASRLTLSSEPNEKTA